MAAGSAYLEALRKGEREVLKPYERSQRGFARGEEIDADRAKSEASHLSPTFDIGKGLPRRSSPGLPRPTTFRRQEAELRDRLVPFEADKSESRTAARLTNVSPEQVSEKAVESNGIAVEEAPSAVQHGVPIIDNNDTALSNNAFAQGRRDQQMKHELETKWILNLSMHFRDKSPRVKFFITYAEDPTTWRKVTVTCDYSNASPDSLEYDLKTLRNERDKSAIIYESIRSSLPEIQFYDTVTNLKLETRDERLHVHVTEDVNEIANVPGGGIDHDIPVKGGPNDSKLFRKPEVSWKSKDYESEAKKVIEREKWAKNIVQNSAQVVERAFLGLPDSRISKVKQGLTGFANGSNTKAMADTGSRENIISASYAKGLGLKVEGSPSIFKIGNARKIQSLGTVSFLWAFAENPKESLSILCHVLPNCTYDLILGNSFLKATETLTKFRHRLKKCLFSVINKVSAHFSFLGETYERLEGIIGGEHYALAVPDTGADRNVVSLQYAIRKGVDIKTESHNRGFLQFADGSFDETMGQVETSWTFASGERIPITFEVLEHCCSYVIIGEDILTEHNVFQDHAGSILSGLQIDEDSYELAPFDFVNSWQRGCNRLIEKLSTRKNLPRHNTGSEKTRIEEQHRRDVWNHKYDFGATASTGERALEKVRREDYISRYSSASGDHQNRNSSSLQRGDGGPSMSQRSTMPMVPSIPTSQSRP